MEDSKATYTENLKLEKPDRDDFYDIEVFNRNADIIDKFLSGIRNNSVAVFIRSSEPPENNCFWIKPLSEEPVEEDTALFILTDDENASDYFVDIDGNEKTIENAVNTDEELTNGKYSFQS